VIEQVKRQLSKTMQEKDDMKSKLVAVTSQRDDMEMNFESTMRGYK
jgi:flagellar biosynthesis chaperone FliJ